MIFDKLEQLNSEYVVVKPNNMGASLLTEKIKKRDIDSQMKRN